MDGELLSADDGAWAGTPPIDTSFRWERCRPDGSSCDPIEGATGSTYRATAGDVGSAVRVVVTAVNRGGEAKATSDLTPVIEAEPPSPRRQPSIDDTSPEYGQTLSADPGDWGGTPEIEFAYQ
jgi:hypothetical protein